MTHRLFIIGNGFDLHHGIPSRYSDFGRYVETKEPDVHRLIGEYLFFDKDFWNEFEDRLASFDSDQVIDYATNFLVSYGADDWSDADHHNFEYEIEQIVEGLATKMRKRFAEWIRGLPIPAPRTVPLVHCVDPGARFLNFNYTPTLQILYGVPDANILHIHGSSGSPDEEVVLGHGWERQSDELLSGQVDEDTDTRVAGGYQLIDDYFAATFKPTAKIIESNRTFFSGLRNISEIWVLGHSLSDVDAQYFEEIVTCSNPSTRWTISYYNNLPEMKSRLSQLGVVEALVQFSPLDKL